MIDHNISGMSESEEMYLVAIASMVERGEGEPIPIARLAEELSILPVSANQMVHKLAEDNLVSYLPYKGVELTTKGRQIAQGILRQRRLWEVFLVEHLGVSPGEADALACRFEHITPTLVTDQLDDFLGHPPFSSQGLLIPDSSAQDIDQISLPLAELPVGEAREVIALEVDKATQAFLDSVGVKLGSLVSPLASSTSGNMLLQVRNNRIHLAGELTWSIRVKVG